MLRRLSGCSQPPAIYATENAIPPELSSEAEMKAFPKNIAPILVVVLLATALSCAQQETTERPDFVLVVHGGAGTILKKNMTPERESAYTEMLTEAMKRGYQILDNNGTALSAVEAAIRILEDSPLFNAGKGAVFTGAGKNELDASIMDGETLNAGAVASVTTIKNPISAARAVMLKSKHVLLVGAGAEMFAAAQGLEIVKQEYFFDQNRWDQLLKAKESDNASLAPSGDGSTVKFGTVGVLALDREGNLAASLGFEFGNDMRQCLFGMKVFHRQG